MFRRPFTRVLAAMSVLAATALGGAAEDEARWSPSWPI